ncbi:MAG: ribosome-associated translation inhibitor RaiA [Deltaproteobacteria bacterium]|nr:ribosome-associated translation inhibitor RaiA [Deltaproteobacteria bacterium]
MPSSDALRSYVETKLLKVKKYLDEPIEAHVALTAEKTQHRASIQIDAHGTRVKAEHSTTDMYATVDLAVDKIEKQLRRHKDRMKEHHATTHAGSLRMAQKETIRKPSRAAEPRAGSNLQIIRIEPIDGKPMTVDEASLQLGFMKNRFIVFRNMESDEVNVLYKRKDGALGLIVPGR